LLVATQSETSDEAAQTFEASMGRLKKLEVAAGYVELLKEVDALRWVNLAHKRTHGQRLTGTQRWMHVGTRHIRRGRSTAIPQAPAAYHEPKTSTRCCGWRCSTLAGPHRSAGRQSKGTNPEVVLG
jgi:hypothetical protein